MNILKNLLGYNGKKLEEIIINGESYFTDKNFSPAYILGQAFGADTDKESYNNYLAQAVLDAREYFQENIPAIVQSEIGVCLNNLRAKKESIYEVGEIYTSKEKSLIISKIDTKGVLIEAKKMLGKLGLPYNSALFVAHPYHMERVLHTAEGLGISGKPFVKQTVEWPQKDSQSWVKSPFLFVPREILARIITK